MFPTRTRSEPPHSAWAGCTTCARRGAWPAAGLALALLLSLTPAFALLDRSWHDITLRWMAGAPTAGSTLLVDIDDDSMQSLRSRHGAWPWSREVHAAAAESLLKMGARAVVFNLLFAEPRAGDEALQRLASSHPGRIVFAADVRPDAVGGVRPATPRQRAAGWSVDRAVPARQWAGWLPPSDGVLPDKPRIGVLPTVPDEDGALRCATLLHRVDGLALPSLLLAALTAGEPLPMVVLDDDARTLRVGARHWPVDRQGCVTPRLPRGSPTVPMLSFAALASGGEAEGLAARVQGRTVYIGSPSSLDARVMTPLGRFGTTTWQALAHESLATGQVLSPGSAWADGGLLAVALLPALAGLRRRQPSWRLDLRDTTLALAGVAAAAAAMLSVATQASALPLACATLACGLLAGTARWQAWKGKRSQVSVRPSSDPQQRLGDDLHPVPTQSTQPQPEPAPGSRPATRPVTRPGLDPAAIDERFEGDEVLYAQILQVALDQWRTWAEDFERRTAAGDEGGCRRLAHDLKSSAATVGANRLSAAGARLELAILQGQDRASAHADVLAALAELLA